MFQKNLTPLIFYLVLERLAMLTNRVEEDVVLSTSFYVGVKNIFNTRHQQWQISCKQWDHHDNRFEPSLFLNDIQSTLGSCIQMQSCKADGLVTTFPTVNTSIIEW